MSRVDEHETQALAARRIKPSPPGKDSRKSVEWRALDDSVFEIRGYDLAPPFSSFLPGIGGLRGAPLWAMYVNRGQAICSFGYQNKDHAIGEFFSATWAYQLSSLYGFRTFLLEGDGAFFEPFASHSPHGDSGLRTMHIEPHAVSLIDENPEAGWLTSVSYCSVTDTLVPALSRRVRLTNLRSVPRHLRLADGLPVIVPAGVPDLALKRQRRITESFIRVAPHSCGGAMYRVPTSMKDEAVVQETQEAVFYGAWMQGRAGSQAMRLAVDPDAFFGPGSNFLRPEQFLRVEFDPDDQLWMNRLPCAIAVSDLTLDPGETVEFVAYAGLAPNQRMLDEFAARFSTRDVQSQIERKARDLVLEITRPAFAFTSSRELNGYVRQNFLDNLLRGGVPHLFPSRDGDRPVHVFTRRHGDLERDYNEFQVPATPYSEGAGNYRDILQNRRHNAWFYPKSGPADIRTFLELIQPDGYNPLSVEGYRWRIADENTARALSPIQEGPALESFIRLVTQPFTPGQLMLWLAKNSAVPPDSDAWLLDVLGNANATLAARPDLDGYWVDHWIYLVDLFESHQALHPDTHGEVLRQTVGWFDAPRRILPRAERYQVVDGCPRQYGNLAPCRPGDRIDPWPEVTVASKLVALAALKAMTLDPEGRGVEMEAGRPGWNDAMNGLPGVFGSCLSETASLARLCRYLLDQKETWGPIALPDPAARLIHGARPIASTEPYDWESASNLREIYREEASTQWPVRVQEIGAAAVEELLTAIEALCRRGIDAARCSGSPLVHTYFQRDGKVDGSEPVDPRHLNVTPLPLFLEGQVYRLREATSTEEARRVYQALKQSPLYDSALQAFVLNADLSNCSIEVGRARTFTRGVYENESVWLHMSYKLLVELLRHDLHDEFFEAAGTMLVPFMPPERYGRSIYENSSYIASSRCPDRKIRGRGFVARLSGSTAEFIHLWQMMTVGKQPFLFEDGELRFRLQPALPGDWFLMAGEEIQWEGERQALPENSLACALFARTLLVYQNESRRNTWGPGGAKVLGYVLDGQAHEGEWLPDHVARAIRDGQIRRIDVLLG